MPAPRCGSDVHYVRCVKPNAASVPHEFTDELVADQLRFAGMLEAVRISRAAFPHRLELLAFAGHFGALAAAVVAAAAEAPLAERVAKLLKALLPDGGDGQPNPELGIETEPCPAELLSADGEAERFDGLS